MSIRILPPEIASQIAAGEVVERPASVVKELVENALDAGAHSISIWVKDAGRTLIRVADDGCGIPSVELPLAVARHATSKLNSAADLFRIATLGFRGEALASIASVAHLTITSRTAEEDMGACLRVEGGVAGPLERIGAPVGTVVEVKNLFFNVPARLKFLKQPVTERRAIDALITRYALAYPKVRFRLEVEGHVVLQTSGDGDRRAILATLYGVEVGRQLVEVESKEETLYLSGFVSPPSLTRSNRREITFFVNGRWIQDVPLTTALLQAYHTLLMVGRFPLVVLFISLPPEDVDVNVHPAKTEVRFRDSDGLFRFVQRAVRRALLASSPVPSLPSQMFWSGSGRNIDSGWALGHGTSTEASSLPLESFEQAGKVGGTISASSGQGTLPSSLPLLRAVGQVAASYLVAEGPDGLYLVDQHAAHERVLFEKLMAQYTQNQIPVQRLLQPVIVHLPPENARILDQSLDVLRGLGFDVESFGPATYQIRALPSLFAGGDPAMVLRAAIEKFEEDETSLQSEREARLAARICKRLAIRAGQVLSLEEQRALLYDLEQCESPRTCPHGRPTMIHISVDLLERQFGRRGAR